MYFIYICQLKLIIKSQRQRTQQIVMDDYLMFTSFAPSQDVSPKTLKNSTSQSLNEANIHKFSIHLPEQFFQPENKCEKQEKQDNIQVFCRLRQPTKVGSNINYDATMIDDGENRYSFDYIFGKQAHQEQIYTQIAKRHIDDFLIGKNSTIFAYGQTGSGKTYTMFGNMRQPQQYGLIPRILGEIFEKDIENSVITCSMLEIYNEKIMDLLNPSQNLQIKLKEQVQGVLLEGLIEVSVQNSDEVLNLIKLGHKGRKIASTSTNDASSRSHTVLFVYRNYKCQNNEMRVKLCFIDLAGSQKIRKSNAKGQTLEEAKKINLSLSCLGNVIHALTNGSQHIPYRTSKLTRILKDSLNGNTKTSIVTTCSLQKSDYLQTISTIKFAIRAKRIKNKKKLDSIEISMQTMIQSLKKQLQATKEQLAWYKKKQQIQKSTIEDIPEQSVNSLPMMSLLFSGGVSSRVRFINSLKSQ